MKFSSTTKLLAAAAAVVTAEFALFGNVLSNIAPPVPDVETKVGLASLFSLVIFLIVTLIIKNRADLRFRVIVATVGTILFFAAIATYFIYEGLQAEYVYLYPPSETAEVKSRRFIRGDLHAEGIKRIGLQTVSAAVFDLGGPEFVVGEQLLWTERSQRNVVLLLTGLYLGFVALIGAALYCLIGVYAA